MLFLAGRITAEQRDEARRIEAQDREAGMGRALIACGALSPKDLAEARREQARRVVLGLFEWPAGEYRFEERQSQSGWSAPVDLPILDLVADGIRGVRNADLFRERLPSPDWTFEAAADNEAVALEPHERHILGLLEGGLTVAEVQAAAEYTDPE